MSDMTQNDKRADWADKAINTFIETTGTDKEDALSDLLCDIMHWCDLYSEYDFEQQLQRAKGHYEAESALCIREQRPDDNWVSEYGESFELDEFADPGGNSALRAASKSNPRNLPCTTCHQPNRLTLKDQALGYQCDQCADQDERGGF